MRKYIVVLAALPALVLGLAVKASATEVHHPPCHVAPGTLVELPQVEQLRRIPPHCPTTTTSTSTSTSTTTTTVAPTTTTTVQQNITVNVAPAPAAVVAQPTFTG